MNRLPSDTHAEMNIVRDKVITDVGVVVNNWMHEESQRTGNPMNAIQCATAVALVRLGWLYMAKAAGFDDDQAIELTRGGAEALAAAIKKWSN